MPNVTLTCITFAAGISAGFLAHTIAHFPAINRVQEEGRAIPGDRDAFDAPALGFSDFEQKALNLLLGPKDLVTASSISALVGSKIEPKDLGDIVFYLLCVRPTDLSEWKNPLSDEVTISALDHFTDVHYRVLNERSGAYSLERISMAEAIWNVFADRILTVYEHAFLSSSRSNYKALDLVYSALGSDGLPSHIRMQIGALAIHYGQLSAMEVAEALNGHDSATGAANEDVILNPRQDRSQALRAVLGEYDLRDFDLGDVRLTGDLMQDSDHLRMIASQKLYQTGHLESVVFTDPKLRNSVTLRTLEQYASSLPREAFQKALEEGQQTGFMAATYQVMRTWLNSNMLEASKHIEQVPAGLERDWLSAFVAKYSASYGDHEAALKWLKYVDSDEIHRDTSRYLSELLGETTTADH